MSAASVPPRVLSVAGTDPTGGAGVQADLKSIAANGGYGMAAVTALVAQNTRGVRSVHRVPAGFLGEQLEAVSDDVTIDAVKIGMLSDPPTVEVVAAWLRRVRPPIVVLDPVMVATSGDRLIDDRTEQALHDLIGLAGLITPNVPELAVLSGRAPATGWDEAVDQALEVSARWSVRVLAKGGHLAGDQVHDGLVEAGAAEPVRRLSAPRIATIATHGTGCSLSSAVATWQVSTGDWFTSVDRSKRWLAESLRHGDELEVGLGHGPVSHFAGMWRRGGTLTSTSAEWWARTADLRAAMEGDPFLVGLAEGTLDAEVFVRYLAQDTHYLDGYAAVLDRLARHAPDPAEQTFWAACAQACLTTETALHRRWAAGPAPAPAAATRTYLEHLRAAAGQGYAQGVAAVLPCFWVYADLGARLDPAGNRYADWIITYADPAFQRSTDTARRIADRAAEAVDPVTREAMWRAFERSTEQERAFFAAACPAPHGERRNTPLPFRNLGGTART